MSSFSENEDDPEVYEDSSEDWNSSEADNNKKKRNNRRSSTRANKKAKVKSEDEEIEEVEEEEEEEDTSENSDSEDSNKARNGVNKKDRLKNIPTKGFSTGSFLILKKDAQKGDPANTIVWRVDGKALLQKYEPFKEDGAVRHKTTSIYTGWSSLDKDLYAPITIKASVQKNQTLIVDVDWEKVKEINNDSD